MSRLSAKRLFSGRVRADLRPGSVTLARKSGLLGSRLEVFEAVEVQRDEAADAQSEPWRASIDSLANALGRAQARISALQVVVSGHFVRYALVPWSENLVRDAERLAFARLAFREVYGNLVDRWEVCMDDQPAGQPALACAIDRELLVAIHRAVEIVGARVEAITPALADCVNRHRSALKSRQFCLASAEFGRVTFAFRARTGWLAIRSRRVDGALSELLPTLLKQEASACGVPEGGVLYLCAPPLEHQSSEPIPGWQVVPLVEADVPPAPVMEPALISMEG